MEKPAVLLLERELAVIEVAQRCLVDEIDLHVSKSIEMALRVAARKPPAVAILDTIMVGSFPAETVHKLRSHHPAVRVIFLAEPAFTVDRRYTQLGFVVRKPVTVERLSDAIRTALRLQGMSVGVEKMRSSSGTMRAVRLPETPPGGLMSLSSFPPGSDIPTAYEPNPDSQSGERTRDSGLVERARESGLMGPPRESSPMEPPPESSPGEKRPSIGPKPVARVR